MDAPRADTSPALPGTSADVSTCALLVFRSMNMGFLLLAYNQISNNAGMLHYTSGGQYKARLLCLTMEVPIKAQCEPTVRSTMYRRPVVWPSGKQGARLECCH